MTFYNGLLSDIGSDEGLRGPQGFPGVGFELDADGNYDIENKKLTNVATPTATHDAATKKYIDDEIGKSNSGHTSNLSDYLKKDGSTLLTGDLNVGGNKIVNIAEPSHDHEVANKKYVDDELNAVDLSVFMKRDGSTPMTSSLNVGNHKITNVAPPTSSLDATTKKYVDDSTALKVNTSRVQTGGDAEAGKLVKYLPDKGIITPKLYVPDQYNDSVILKADGQQYDNISLYIPDLKNYDGNANRRKSSVVVDSVDNTLTGKLILPSGHIIIKDGNNQVVINRADIEKLFGTQGGSNGITTNKCVLYDNNGTIYANNYGTKVGNNFVFLRARNQSAWRSLFIPNLGGGDANIVVDQTNQTINGDKTFSRAITMSQEGSASNHLVTKAYVDNHSTNGNYLKTDGTNSMTGDLNMGNHKIVTVGEPSDESDVATVRSSIQRWLTFKMCFIPCLVT